MNNARHACEHQKTSWGRPVGNRCGKTASFHERDRDSLGELRWFCGTHAPSQRKARAEKQRKAAREQWDLQQKALDRERVLQMAEKAVVEAALAVYHHALPPALRIAVERLLELRRSKT